MSATAMSAHDDRAALAREIVDQVGMQLQVTHWSVGDRLGCERRVLAALSRASQAAPAAPTTDGEWSKERIVAALLSDLYRVIDANGLSCGRSIYADLTEPALRLMDAHRPPGNVNDWPDRGTVIRMAKERIAAQAWMGFEQQPTPPPAPAAPTTEPEHELCPEGALGQHVIDNRGCCIWCYVRFVPWQPTPPPAAVEKTGRAWSACPTWVVNLSAKHALAALRTENDDRDHTLHDYQQRFAAAIMDALAANPSPANGSPA